MIEPWFIAQNWAWVPGTVLGLFGGLWGAASGSLAPRGKAKGIILGSGIAALIASAVSLAAGLVALAVGQPFGVWYTLLLPGVLGLMVLCPLVPMVWFRYRQAEGRKMQADDLSLS